MRALRPAAALTPSAFALVVSMGFSEARGARCRHCVSRVPNRACSGWSSSLRVYSYANRETTLLVASLAGQPSGLSTRRSAQENTPQRASDADTGEPAEFARG